ncbi:RHS repeat-associated core domain-containing protein [Lentisphaerota bacterium WC36G]|nr:RHS repeat-associated core domain-containing protein [Lentisphaerae bacterium WC36]
MSSGSITNRYDYSPFGQLSKNNETVANVFKFSSEYAEKETGLVYYNYRYYNPTTGKWLKRDPIQEAGGLNLYAFIGNSVINKVDKNGLEQEKKEGQRFFKDGKEKVVGMPSSIPGVNIGAYWRDTIRALEYSLVVNKRCVNKMAEIELVESKFNVVNYIDTVNIGIGIMSFGHSLSTIHIPKTRAKTCPKGQDGAISKLIVSIAVIQIFSASVSPSIGPFSADNGYQMERGMNVKLFFEVEFEKRCCCDE